MTMRKKFYPLVLLSAFLLFCGKTSAQDEVTVDVHYLVRLARTRSSLAARATILLSASTA